MTSREDEKPGTKLSRRSVIAMSAGALAAAGIAIAPGRSLADEATPASGHSMNMGSTPEATPESTPVAPPWEPVTGEELTEPEVRQSVNGLLDTTFEAKTREVTVAGTKVTSIGYEGQFSGPTLRMNQSETLKLKIINNLDAVTNIHTHGFHVTPQGNSDNIFIHINPGETFNYEYNLPESNFPGTFWYHPHAHGNTAVQTTFGMTGMIIVDGPGLDDIEGIKGLPDRVMLLQSTQYDGNGNMVPFNTQTAASRYRLINGHYQPKITMKPGETQRWRVANVCSDDFFLLALSGHTLYQIAGDGNAFKQTVPMQNLLLGPAERAEFLIQASSTPGSYELRSLLWGPDYQAQPDALIATVVVEGDPVTPQTIPMELVPFEDLSTLPVDHSRTTVFEEPGPPLYLAIDGKHWDPDRIDQTVKLGDLEEWTIENTSSHWHPFHIHINDFQVVSVNGEPTEAMGLNDTVALPPHSTTVMRSRFAEFTGKFVYHCHILSHEDFGMMANVLVVE